LSTINVILFPVANLFYLLLLILSHECETSQKLKIYTDDVVNCVWIWYYISS